MDPLEAVFLFCFVFGVAMSGLSFLLGSLHLPGLGHHGGGHEVGAHGHAELGHHGGHGLGGGHGHADVHPGHGGHGSAGHGEPGERAVRSEPSPFNVNTATAFLAFFGGVGYLLHGTLGLGAAVALVVAVVAGLAGGSVVFLFLTRVLLAGQRFLDPAEFRMEGSVARVSAQIRADGIGEIVYSRDGTLRSEGARSATGQALPIGTEVVVVKYERGIAYVEPWESYAADR